MKRRGSGETPSVIRVIEGLYKAIAISSELMARLAGVRNESQSVVYEREMVI